MRVSPVVEERGYSGIYSTLRKYLQVCFRFLCLVYCLSITISSPLKMAYYHYRMNEANLFGLQETGDEEYPRD